ncbi:MAG: hypothetical protein PVG60_01630 [Desulfarculaceae bacterium]|jgi:hypothetical protein
MKHQALILGLALCLAFSISAGVAVADEITDQIKQGLELYEKGKVSEAINELDFALAQMRQKKGEALGEIFPPAPDGWKAEEPKSQTAGRAMLGGGINVTRVYKQTKGRGIVEIEVLTDSPLMQTMAMALSNPMVMQSSGGKLTKVKGHKAVVKSTGKKRAELQSLVDGKVLFKVDARGLDDAQDVAKEFAEKFNFDKLRELTK